MKLSVGGCVSSVCSWVLLLSMFCGCASSYSWRSSVPERYRTVSVPVFRNESGLNEIGSVATRQVLREFQREGTFRIRGVGDSAIEVQGIVKNVGAGSRAYDRRTGLRYQAFEMTAEVEVSVIDKLQGRVLVDSRKFTASTSFIAGQDLTTSERDAAGRLGDDLSRQIVDAVLALNYEDGDKQEDK